MKFIILTLLLTGCGKTLQPDSFELSQACTNIYKDLHAVRAGENAEIFRTLSDCRARFNRAALIDRSQTTPGSVLSYQISSDLTAFVERHENSLWLVLK